ncbi:MAG: helix-turn-helix transcriptional regulator [Coprococcus phoceensis]
MDRPNYGHYEEVAYEYCPLAILEKLATLYNIPVTDLMDDYHLFLYTGQGNRVLQYRKNLHLTQQEMADKLGVNRTTVRLWEKEFHRMTRPTYEALFIQKILE